MQLRTLSFKGKTASIIWMLLLALSLVLIDYFLSPVMTEGLWTFTKVEEKKIEIKEIVNIEKQILSCNQNKKILQLHPELKSATRICFSKGKITEKSVFLIQSKYKGILKIYQNGKLFTIAKNLQEPELINISSELDIYLFEKGRQRYLKFHIKQEN